MSRPFASESVFRAIADPTRRRILDLLRREEMTVSEIAQALRISIGTLSPHLRVLRTAGLVGQRRRKSYRLYSLNPQNLQSALMWLRQYERL